MNATNVERIKTLEEEVKRQGEEIAHLKSFTDSLFIRIVTHEMESRKPEQAKSPARISPSADSRYTERELVAAGEIEKIQPLVRHMLERFGSRGVNLSDGAWVPVWNEIEISDVLHECGVVDEAIENFLATLRGLLVREEE